MTLVETIAELASVEDKIAAELARVGRGTERHAELTELLEHNAKTRCGQGK